MDTLGNFYTEEQIKRYFIDKNVRKCDIEHWTSQQLVLYVYAELMESAGAVADYVHFLCSEEGYGFTSSAQQHLFRDLQREGNVVPILIDTMRRWLFFKKVIRLDGQSRSDEQFIPLFVDKKEDMPDILAWTDIHCISYLSKNLKQRSKEVLRIVANLLDEPTYGFTCDGQRDSLHYLHEEIEVIYRMTNTLNLWLSREKK